MNSNIERKNAKRSLCLWFHNPMANKPIIKTPSIAANDAKNFLQITSKFCDPITEYNENLSNLRPKTEWAMYGRPVITNRRHKILSNKPSPVEDDELGKKNCNSDSEIIKRATVEELIVRPVTHELVSNCETDFSEDTEITKSDESSLYNFKDIDDFSVSNPLLEAYNTENDLLSNKPFKMWSSNVTLCTMDVMNNVKMVMNRVYIDDNFSLDSITNTTPSIRDSDTPPNHINVHMPDGTIYMGNSTDNRNNDPQKINNNDNYGSYKYDGDKSQQGSIKLDLATPKAGESLLRDIDIILGIDHNTPKQLDSNEKKISASLLKLAFDELSDNDLTSDDSQSQEDDFEDVTMVSGENSRILKVEVFNRIYKILKSLPLLKNNRVVLDPSKFIKTNVLWDWNGTRRVQLNSSDNHDVKYDFVYLCLKRGMPVTLMARHRGWVYASAQGSKQRGWFPWYMLVEPETLIQYS